MSRTAMRVIDSNVQSNLTFSFMSFSVHTDY